MTRVVLAPGLRGWSYDLTAQALAHELADRFDIEIAYEEWNVEAIADRADVIVDFWWRGAFEQKFGTRVIKQVSSHRWQQHRYGKLPPSLLAARHLSKAGAVVVPSQRLLALVTSAGIPAAIAPKGFDPALFSSVDRNGPLVVGWAGNAHQLDKRVSTIVKAWPELLTVGIGTPRGSVPYEEMPAFYRSLDVITCASDAEGDPRTLIEGMACGCFPVVVDVGIVPELVQHEVNGLIVERTPEAFAAAFAWCGANLDFVRAAGRMNAEQMLRERTWQACAVKWADAFDALVAARQAA